MPSALRTSRPPRARARQSSPPPARRKRVDVLFARAQEIEKIQPLVFARFADAQQNQIFSSPLFSAAPSDDIPKRGEGFDRVLGIVVVPRHSIKAQKCKQLFLIFLEPVS